MIKKGSFFSVLGNLYSSPPNFAKNYKFSCFNIFALHCELQALISAVHTLTLNRKGGGTIIVLNEPIT